MVLALFFVGTLFTFGTVVCLFFANCFCVQFVSSPSANASPQTLKTPPVLSLRPSCTMRRSWFFIFCLVASNAEALPETLRLSSLAEGPSVRSMIGEYSADGELNGFTRYKRTDASQPQEGERYLFFSITERWSIATSAADAAASKRIVAMATKGGSPTPLGLKYRIYDGHGTWATDDSMQVRKFDAPLQ